MSTQPTTLDRAGGCFESLRGGCMLGLWNCFFLAFIALMTYFFWSSFTLATQGVPATAQVIGLDESNGENGVTYSPIFTYEVDGQTYEATSSMSSDPPAYRIGAEAPIRYNPANPEHADIDSFLTSPWIYGGAFAILALAMIFLNVVSIRRIWRGESIDDE